MVNIYQNNAQIHQQFVADEMHFGSVQSPADLVLALQTLQANVQRAGIERALNADQSEAAQRYVGAALEQVRAGNTDKPTLLGYLKEAKDVVSGVGGLATAIQAAIAAVGLLFG